MGVFWACCAFERINVRNPYHMTDLNRYRREASSLSIEYIWLSVARSRNIKYGTRLCHIWKYGTRLYHIWKCHCIQPVTKHAHIVSTLLFFPYFSSLSYYFARGDGNCVQYGDDV